MGKYTKNISEYLAKEIDVIQHLDPDELSAAMEAIEAAWRRNGTIYTMGNGGSAASASHMVCDFNKGVSAKTGKKFRLECLCDNIASVMAIANDIGYEDVFSYQLEGRLEPDDLLIAISGSGNSPNIIKAVKYAQSLGVKVIGMTGYHGGKLKELADCSMHVPVDDMQITEDLHMVFNHMMMQIFCIRLK